MDVSDRWHPQVRAYVERLSEPALLPVTALVEVDYFVSTRLGLQAALAVLRSVRAGNFPAEPMNHADLTRAIELVEQYADGDIGLVDASIVAVAERLRITRILTLDRRHFAMFRPRHCPAFELVP